MKKILHTIFFGIVIFGLTYSTEAQSPVADEKRKLIAELVTILKMDSQMSQLTDTILKEMETTYPIAFGAAVDSNPKLTLKEKEALKSESGERYRRFSEKFRKRLAESVDYPKFVQEAVYPLYDQIFTEQELRDLVVFYRTPTGQSVVTKMPQLFATSQVAAREKLLPQILPIVKQMVEEEFGRVGAAPPAKKDNK